MEKKVLRVALDLEHEEQLQWLMQKWGLDRNATLGRIIEDVDPPKLRRELMVSTIVATQAREGIVTTPEQADAVYNKVQQEKAPPRE